MRNFSLIEANSIVEVFKNKLYSLHNYPKPLLSELTKYRNDYSFVGSSDNAGTILRIVKEGASHKMELLEVEYELVETTITTTEQDLTLYFNSITRILVEKLLDKLEGGVVDTLKNSTEETSIHSSTLQEDIPDNTFIVGSDLYILNGIKTLALDVKDYLYIDKNKVMLLSHSISENINIDEDKKQINFMISSYNHLYIYGHIDYSNPEVVYKVYTKYAVYKHNETIGYSGTLGLPF